ncbi:MAG: YeeE/YedE family protein [Halomonadaceae bacterium]|nr:MAG: YeeE/YedE family protein [Halomonadaceae bacterium]
MIVPGLIGGLMIGLAVVFMMATLGRVVGISGIVDSLIPPRMAPDKIWRLTFIAGLLLGPLLVALATGESGIGRVADHVPLAVLAGLLVGVGTVIGSGCTSGHGVCGIARFSRRSLVATGVFMVAGIVTVAIMRHVI